MLLSDKTRKSMYMSHYQSSRVEYITFCLSFQESHPAFSEIVLKKSHLKKMKLKKKIGTEILDVFNNAAARWADSLQEGLSLSSHFPAGLGKHKAISFCPKFMFIIAEQGKIGFTDISIDHHSFPVYQEFIVKVNKFIFVVYGVQHFLIIAFREYPNSIGLYSVNRQRRLLSTCL